MATAATRKRLESLVAEAARTLEADEAGPRHTRYAGRPVEYAAEVLGIRTLTPEQCQMLEALHKPPYKVLVPSAHDVGKCVEVNELLTLADGRRVRAGDLVGTWFMLLSPTPSGPTRVAARAEWNRAEPVYRLTTESGRAIVRNAAHPLWAGRANMSATTTSRRGVEAKGWTPLAGLAPGDLVAVTSWLPAFGNKPLPAEHVILLAYLIGDGGYTGTTCTFTQQDNAQLAEFARAAAALGCHLKRCRGDDYTYRVVGDGTRQTYAAPASPSGVITRRVNRVRDLLRRHGLLGKHSRDKRVPGAIFELPEDQLRLFVNRLYATDGWASMSNKASRAPNLELGFCSTSEGLCRDLQELLTRLGIRSCLARRRTVNAWTLSVRDAADVLRFCDEVGIYGKELAVAAVREAAARRQASPKCKRWRANNAPPGTFWERVASVEELPQSMTVAVEVPGTHTFLTMLWEHNTFAAAVAVNYWYDSFDPGIVITTAPTQRDVVDLLWTEVRLQRQRAALPMAFIGPRAPEMRTGDDHYAKGFTAVKGESFQGRHRERMLFVMDEANGVESLYWTTTKTMFDPALGHAWLCIFNPTDTTTQAYLEDSRCDDADGQPNWHRIRVNALTHPNVTAELAGGKAHIPGAVTLAMVNEWVREWCDPVLNPGDVRATDVEWPPGSEKFHRPGPIFQARAMGCWPDTGSGVWSPALFEACLTGPVPAFPLDHAPVIGCDCATGKGDDYHAIHTRWGSVSIAHETSNTMDAVRIAGRLRDCAAAAAAFANDLRNPRAEPFRPQQVRINLDDDGTGNAVSAMLKREGYATFLVSAAGTSSKPEQYPRRRDELWFAAADRAKNGMLCLSLLDRATKARLRQQLLAPAWDLDGAGRRVVEKKDDTKEKIGRSPDDADALNLAYHETGFVTGPAVENTRASHRPAETPGGTFRRGAR